MSEAGRKEYWIGDLAVVWRAEKCIPPEECRRALDPAQGRRAAGRPGVRAQVMPDGPLVVTGTL